MASPEISYFPAPILLFKAVFKLTSVKLPNPWVNASVTDNFTNSSVCAVPVFCLASLALFNMPFSPVRIAILITANIKSTIENSYHMKKTVYLLSFYCIILYIFF